MHPKVFISHASEDKDRFVTDFARRLRSKGVDAWYDQWEMKPGDRLIEKIFEDGISNAETLIVILSQCSVTKPWVREEMDVGFVRRVQNRMRLIPVIIEQCDVPTALQATYWVRINDLSNYEAELEQIVSAIFGLSDKPALGTAPAHAETKIAGIPNLARVDNIVLRTVCEAAIQDGDFALTPDRLWKLVEPQGFSRRDMEDSLTILDQYHFIDGHRGNNRIIAFRITLYGFHEYAKAYFPELDSTMNAIVARYVNDGMNSSGEVAASLELPQLIVEYVLELLANNRKMTISTPIGRDIYIADISPELRRMLQ